MRTGEVLRYEGKRGVTWRLRYRDSTGKRVRKVLGPEPQWNERRAQAELRRRLVAVDDGYREPERLSFAAFADRFEREYLPGRNLKTSTLTDYEGTLRVHLRPFFGSLALGAIEPEHIDAYIAAKVGRLSPKTVSNHLGLLRVMFKGRARRGFGPQKSYIPRVLFSGHTSSRDLESHPLVGKPCRIRG